MATTQPQKDAAAALLAKAGPALTSNIAYLAVGSPNVAQNTAQIKALTRQVNAMMRLVCGMYGSHTLLSDGPDT